MEKINLNEKIYGDKNKLEEKDSLSNNPRNMKIDKQPSLSEMDEKLDRIIKYQRRVAHMAVFRGIISFIFFLVFIVIPIIGSYYLVRYVSESDDYKNIVNQYQEFYEMAGDIKDAKDQVGDFKDTLGNATNSLKKLLPGGDEGTSALPIK